MEIIAIGSDHAGFELKKKIIEHLGSLNCRVLDKGCYSEERTDYPDYAHEVAHEVLNKGAGLGILLCGSGNGIAMTANKHKGIRAALCWNTEIATLARQHNDANVLVLPARYMGAQEAFACITVFLSTKFEGGRHADRVKKIDI